MFVVTEVTTDFIHEMSVVTYGPYETPEAADRFRRQLLAHNVDRQYRPSVVRVSAVQRPPATPLS